MFTKPFCCTRIEACKIYAKKLTTKLESLEFYSSAQNCLKVLRFSGNKELQSNFPLNHTLKDSQRYQLIL